ncbi:unnamed protein product [Ranitomeya imitator]|uniref:Uncharacterized protein n=1 Tax=Ranitomeya imitator TaxID=111125 RepID=A0ABN9LAH8_9NEOB|nr:unnamed protein product [Ranitomeya imitator]
MESIGSTIKMMFQNWENPLMVDAFLRKWDFNLAYAFPPLSLLPLVFLDDRVVLKPDPAYLPNVASDFHKSQEIGKKDFVPNPTSQKEEKLHTLDVLLALPELAHSDYEHLMSSPLLMVEQLLMNMKIEWVSVAIKTLQQLLIEPDFTFSVEDVDTLLSTYAGKALDIPFSFREKRTDSVSRVPESSSQPADPEQVLLPSPAELTNSPYVERFRLQSPAGLPDKVHRRNRSSPEFIPPDKPPAKTQWIPDETEVTCMVCKNERFTMMPLPHPHYIPIHSRNIHLFEGKK